MGENGWLVVEESPRRTCSQAFPDKSFPMTKFSKLKKLSLNGQITELDLWGSPFVLKIWVTINIKQPKYTVWSLEWEYGQI